MQISSSDLINLPVYTQSGKHLGRVASFDIDIDTNGITAYYVKTGLIKGLWYQQLAISPKQVVSISKEKMIVEDNIGKEPAKAFEMEMAAPLTK